MIKVGARQNCRPSFAGSRPAMIRLALASPWIAVLSFDLRCATLVLPIAIGRLRSSSPQSLPSKAFNACRNTPSAPQSHSV